MSRLIKYLESKTKDVRHNASGSSYFTFGNKLIRVSNHLPPIKHPNDLHILVSGNSNTIYVTAVHGKVFTFVGLRSIRDFIDHWLIIADSNLNYTDDSANDRILELREKVNELNMRAVKAERYKPVRVGGIAAKDKVFDINSFSKSQQNMILGFIKQRK